MLHHKNIAALKGKVDFGIITIRDDEFKAVLQRLPTEQLVTGRHTYAISRLQIANNDEYLIATVRCPEPGNGQGQAVAHSLIEDLDPQWILLVGIAGSVPDYEYTLGDVLLATRLHDYCVSASIENSLQQISQQSSVRGGPMLPQVQSLIAATQAFIPFLGPWNTPESLGVSRPQVKLTSPNFYGDKQWKKKVRECLNRYFGENGIRNHAEAFTGSIASSDVLVKNTQLANQWLENAREFKGIEMELAGVYQAAWGAQKPVLAIRGISDIVGFKRSPDWTTYACHTAASFAVSLLRFRPIPPLSTTETESKAISSQNSLPQNQPVGMFKSKPPNLLPLQKKETLYSNLIEVSCFIGNPSGRVHM